MSTFLALYRGASIGEARLIAVTSDPTLIRKFATCLLGHDAGPESEADDPIIHSIEGGRKQALRLICREGASDAT